MNTFPEKLVLDPEYGGFRLEGGFYGSYNGHWGVGLRAYDKIPLAGFAPLKAVTRYKDMYHIGRLVYVEPSDFYFKVHPVAYSPNKKKFIVVYGDRHRADNVREISEEEAYGKIGFITANHLVGFKPGLPFTPQDTIAVSFIRLSPGDAFAVPYTSFVMRMDENQPRMGTYFTLDTNGKYVAATNPLKGQMILGRTLMVTGKVVWFLYNPLGYQ